MKPNILPPYVNLCGLLFNRPAGKLEDYLRQVYETLRIIANQGVHGVLFWLPWPVNPYGKTPEHLRNEMIVQPEAGEWGISKFNSYFRDRIFWPVIAKMKEYNLTPVIGLTGYTNSQVLFKKDKNFGFDSLYHDDTIDYIADLVKFLRIDKDCILEPTNEPEAGMQSPDNIRVNVRLARWHYLLIEKLKEIGVSESRIQVSCWDGCDVKTMKRDPKKVMISGVLSALLRGKRRLPSDVQDWDKEYEKIFDAQYPIKKTEVALSCHACYTWEQVIKCTSIARLKMPNFSISLDGSLAKDEGVHGKPLYDFAEAIITRDVSGIDEAPEKKEVTEKNICFFCHPRGIYKEISPGIFIIELDKLQSMYYAPAINAYYAAYRKYPPNYGKFPPAKPEPIEPDPEPEPEPEPEEPAEPILPVNEKSYTKYIYAGIGLIAVILIILLLSC